MPEQGSPQAGEAKLYTKDSDSIIQLITDLLVQRKAPPREEIDEDLLQDEAFLKLYEHVVDLRELSTALSKGDLKHFAYGKGFVLSGLKGLQANLRHLTWQTQMIAQGDFTQKVDFLGEFSVSFNEMVGKLESMNDQLRRLASQDALTKIPNRLSLEQFFEGAFEKAKEEQRPISALLMDIDHFKRINDTYGHPAGDQVLVQVSELLSRQFRSSDLFARFGGEEFIAVLPGADLNLAMQIGRRILETVSEPRFPVEAHGVTLPLHITVSVGASEIQPFDDHYQRIIERIDKALYDAKRSGRNTIRSA